MNAPYTGIPLEKISRLSIRLAADASKTSSGSLMYRARLLRVMDDNGTNASGRGEVFVFVRDGRSYYQGDTLTVEGGLKLSENDDVYVCFTGVDGIDKYTPLRGYSLASLFRVRARVLDSLKRRILRMEDDAGALFLALFLGDRDELPGNLTEGFRRSGTSHVLALSGMHLAIVTGVLALLLKPLAGKRGAFFISLVIIALYIVLAGPKPSLQRAGFMYAIGGAFLLKTGKIQGLHILFLTFFLMAAINPSMLRELSFQLSFLALFGIFTVGGFTGGLLDRYLPSWIRFPLSASLGAQAAVSPLLVFVFGAVYPVGIIASLLISPLTLIFMWLGMALMCLPGEGFFLFHVLNKAAQYLYDAMVMVTEKASLVPPLDCTSAAGKAIVCVLCAAMFAGLFAREGLGIRRIMKPR